MTFAKYVFRIAGVYGLAVTFPLYFMEQSLGVDSPPAMNHPEHYYAFIGVTLVWQILFLVIANDPVRYRTMMLVSVLEKASLVPVFLILYPQGRFPSLWAPLIVDVIFGILFFISYQMSKPKAPQSEASR